MDYIPQEQKAGPQEMEIEVADPSNPVEVDELLDQLSSLNTYKALHAKQFIYRFEDWERFDSIVGPYTVTVISEFDGKGNPKPIMAITYIDKETKLPLANVLNSSLRERNNLLRAKGLEKFAVKRNLQLHAANSRK
jgi:hypothetical protein